MSTASQAARVLQTEIDAAIEAVLSARGQARCEAHDALATAVVVLLRCQRVRLTESGAIIATAGSVGAAAGAVVAAVVEAVRYLM